jgi:peptide/nickel transport system substrate-binding protein
MRWTVLRHFAISCVLVAIGLPAMARTRPHYGGTIRIEIEGDPWQRPDGPARRLVYDGLTALDADGSARPALAIEWKPDNNYHRWQFRLRPEVHFQDGSPLTSVAVAASLTASCGADCPWAAVRSAGSMVVFTVDAAMPNLPVLLASNQFLITLIVTADGRTPVGAIGTGPFQVTSFNDGVLALTANESCWQGRPFADGIEIRVHRPVRDQWFDMGVGKADVVEVPMEQMRQAEQQRLDVVVSPPLSLLALQVVNSGTLANPKLRAAIALAVDRSALYNVIFQKQGEVTASLLPESLTGYSFLFPTDRDLNKAHELRGGQTPAVLTLSAEGSGAMQLAAQRIALNLGEAGFNVQVTGASAAQHADLLLRRIPMGGGAPGAALEQMLRNLGQVGQPGQFGQAVVVPEQTPSALLKAEQDFLSQKTVIPLLELPRAYAVGGRIRDFKLHADGTPDLAGTSLEDSQ